MILLAALLAQAAGAAAAAPPDVVVPARPLAELRADWEACLAGRCTPQEEMRRALNYAEAQVVGGDYPGGWQTLRTAKHRNLRYAEALPVQVATVVKASARLAGLNGQPLGSRVGMIDGVDSLKKGLDSDDARVLEARLDIADAFVPEGRIDAALNQYRRVEQAAREAGLPAVVALTQYRYAVLLTGLGVADGGHMYLPDARRALARIVASPDPAMAPYRDSARLVQLNLVPAPKRLAAVDAMLPTLTPVPPDQPVLAYAPAVDLRWLVADQPPPGEVQQWADVAFRIKPDGRVVDVAATARSPHLPQPWLDAAARTIGERRYLPLQLPADDPGVRHVARATFVFDVASATGTKLAASSDLPRVDIVDMGEPIARR